MTGPDPVAALAARAIGIAEKAQKTQEAIVGQQARSKRTARLLTVSVALDITLSVVTILLALGQASVSQSIHQSQLNGCAIGNKFRVGQVALWDHVIAVSSAPPRETDAQRAKRTATTTAFRAYVHAQFAPVDCGKLYGRP